MPTVDTYSEANSTTTPLRSGATYTGTFQQNDSPHVMVSCRTDNTGTLYFDFSNDGSTVNTFPTAGFKISSGIHEFHTAVKGPRFFRIRLVNDTGAQSYLDLYTYFGTFGQGNTPLNQSIGSDHDAIVVRSVSPEIDLALGRFGGMTEDSKFGTVRLLDAADAAADIWAFANDDISGTPTKTFPTSAQSLYISSDSSSDTDVDVTVSYIDSTGAAATATPNLNGTTAVDMGVTAFDVNRMVVSGATAAVGNIYINTANAHTAGVPDDSTTVLGFITAGFGQTQLCMYTVPLGQTVIIKKIMAIMGRASGAAGSADIHLRVREFGKTWVVKRFYPITSSSGIDTVEAGLVFPERTNIVMRVNDVSDTDTTVTGQFLYDLVDD